MRRIYEAGAYAPQSGCYWADTVPAQQWPRHSGAGTVDTAIIGGGFTGLNAALTLAVAGDKVALFEAQTPGFGASGRNGGFCCLGGAKATGASLARRFGDKAPQDWADTERAAVAHVAGLIDRFGLDVDAHSKGETLMAHSARAWRAMQADAPRIARLYGAAPDLTPASQLAQGGLAGPWHGAMTLPIGFALNPRKYHAGLAQAARQAGAQLFAGSPVKNVHKASQGWTLETPQGQVTARRVVLATNGYSSDDVPDWLRARYLPVQSSVIVTRPITAEEQARQGWTSGQMAYDSRQLLHYFRLMPDGRFLFGMRGGLRATARAQKAISQKIRTDFHRLFPAWRDVEITHDWSGLVCLMPGLVPFVGPVPGHDGMFAAMGFHGNGVAMGSYAGHLIASRVLGQRPDGPCPEFLGQPPGRFPLGRFRRALLAPAYLLAETFDL
ncbi:NAD(P)/FAD-dependent oxidoreductase [Tropicibacter oceani]|uniref:FAD-binding oxidoreductase n=1 Tax=Tropicibacter oceani TaxID=3058420 RepID=A0ABY8QI11_9RHOB|nr:FAD-binding oxidoreductase [Tropicibacter oceani]WGW04179.1 FAD-binding oxidoreductase [Tropicibacter oceani]